MIGTRYWTTGIVLKWLKDDLWSAQIDFLDNGFCDDQSTEGCLHTRYFVPIQAAIDTVIEDAKRLGIKFGGADMTPMIYMIGDGESSDWPPPENWRQIVNDQARRLGWEPAYSEPGSE